MQQLPWLKSQDAEMDQLNRLLQTPAFKPVVELFSQSLLGLVNQVP